mmetsp:Transcript_32523/g.73106  ORF Transcript_32523/g.73106 Transcript_32523/m.73106 type:complete len:202 (-) Transcript_32523:576-1181(-)
MSRRRSRIEISTAPEDPDRDSKTNRSSQKGISPDCRLKRREAVFNAASSTLTKHLRSLCSRCRFAQAGSCRAEYTWTTTVSEFASPSPAAMSTSSALAKCRARCLASWERARMAPKMAARGTRRRVKGSIAMRSWGGEGGELGRSTSWAPMDDPFERCSSLNNFDLSRLLRFLSIFVGLPEASGPRRTEACEEMMKVFRGL